MALPEKLLPPRKRSGLFQEGRAGKPEVSRQTLSRWELGAAQPEAGKPPPLHRLFGGTAERLPDDVRGLAQAAESPAGKRASRCLRALVLAGVGLAGNVSSSPGWRRSHAPCLL